MAKKAHRTTHRSSTGTKLYAVRDAQGGSKDIQTYKRTHGQDIKRRAKKRSPAAFGTLATRRAGRFWSAPGLIALRPSSHNVMARARIYRASEPLSIRDPGLNDLAGAARHRRRSARSPRDRGSARQLCE
jgi:hypothetical protein